LLQRTNLLAERLKCSGASFDEDETILRLPPQAGDDQITI